MRKTEQTGFMRATLIIIGALVILKYVYDIDVVGFLTTGNFRKILDNFYRLGSSGWQKYSEVLLGIWDYVWLFTKDVIYRIKN